MALPSFDATWPAFVYQNEIEKLVHRFKFRSDLAAGRLLGKLLARRLKTLGVGRPDVMMPVPLHPRRLLLRGFNQSALLCRDLAAEMKGLPWINGLKRVRDTATQIHLPADRRVANVRGAFKLDLLPAATRTVALVDDVMTTGSTLNECARILRSVGVERVEVWVVARA
jgi:ComF family protein